MQRAFPVIVVGVVTLFYHLALCFASLPVTFLLYQNKEAKSYDKRADHLHGILPTDGGRHHRNHGPQAAYRAYRTWKSLGYQVKKGEKNIAAFTIWKAHTKKAEADDEEGSKEETRMFMKTAHFFKISQCEKIA